MDQSIEQNGQVTQFRPDHRLGLVRAVRTLALLGMLATVLFAIWSYQDDLSPENMKRLYLYLTAGEQSADFSGYTFESGLHTTCVPFGGGLAVASGDTYYFASGRGGTHFSLQLKYADPMISAGDRFVLVYDLGNSGLCVANSYAEYLNLTLDAPILSAQMNREGDFAVVTAGGGCRSAVTVYDKKQRELCKWMTSQYYVQTTSVSPDGDRFAALCLAQDGLTVHSQVLIFTIGKEEADCAIDLGEKCVYSMCHDKNGVLVILCDDGLYYYDSKGEVLGTYSFTDRPTDFYMTEGEWPVLAFSASDHQGQRAYIVAAGKNGEVLWETTASGAVRSLSRSGEYISVLLGDRLLYANAGSGKTKELAVAGARSVVSGSDGAPIIIYSDRAEKVNWEEAQ